MDKSIKILRYPKQNCLEIQENYQQIQPPSRPSRRACHCPTPPPPPCPCPCPPTPSPRCRLKI